MHHSIEIENLSFKYPDGHQALRDVCLHIEPCEKVALVGTNGAGKSTLILHLNGILTGEGDIRSAGLEVKKENLERIRASILEVQALALEALSDEELAQRLAAIKEEAEKTPSAGD